MKNRAGKLGMGQGGNKLVAFLIVTLIALTALLVAVLFILNRDSQHDQQYIAHTAELRVLSQEIAKNATEAADGTASAFDALRRSRDEFGRLWGYLINGNPDTDLPPSELAQNSDVQQTWETVRDNADSILSTRDTVLGLHDVAQTLNETIPSFRWNTTTSSRFFWRITHPPNRLPWHSASPCWQSGSCVQSTMYCPVTKTR